MKKIQRKKTKGLQYSAENIKKQQVTEGDKFYNEKDYNLKQRFNMYKHSYIKQDDITIHNLKSQK